MHKLSDFSGDCFVRMIRLFRNKRICLITLFILSFSYILFQYNSFESNQHVQIDGWVTNVKVLQQLNDLVASPTLYAEAPSVQNYFNWPVPNHPRSMDDVTSARHTTFTLAKNDFVLPDKYKKGDDITVRITARNGRGEQKEFGGDYFRVLLTSVDLKSSINGFITDNNDGSYTVRLPIIFDGDVILSVILIHPSEAIDLLRRVTSSPGSPGLMFTGMFGGAKEPEESRSCNVWLPSTDNLTRNELERNFCNFQHKKTGEPWLCEKPINSDCSSLNNYVISRSHDAVAILHKSGLFTSKANMRVLIGKQMHIHVNPAAVNQPNPSLPPCTLAEAGSLPPHPGGYFLDDKWQSLHCSAKKFETSKQQAACLKDKTVYFLGDSTIRQWYGYYVRYPGQAMLTEAWGKLTHFLGFSSGVVAWEKGPVRALWEPRKAEDPYNNIKLFFSAHGPPLQNGGAVENMPYMADSLDRIAGGADTYVAMTIGPHLYLYNPIVFVRRLKTIRAAIKRLLKRSPETLVFFRGHNIFTIDDMKVNQCCLSDWLAYRLDTIARAMFKEVEGVVFLDMWDLSASHYSIPGGLHTQPHVVNNEIQLFLSFICPH